MIAKGGCWCPPFTPPQIQALQSSVFPHTSPLPELRSRHTSI